MHAEVQLYRALQRTEVLIAAGQDALRAVHAAATAECADEDALARVVLRKLVAVGRARAMLACDASIERASLYEAPGDSPEAPPP